jgi:hypothetical protein
MALQANLLEDAPDDSHLFGYHTVVPYFGVVLETERGATIWNYLSGTRTALFALAHVGEGLIPKVFGEISLDAVEEFALGRLVVLTVEADHINAVGLHLQDEDILVRGFPE